MQKAEGIVMNENELGNELSKSPVSDSILQFWAKFSVVLCKRKSQLVR